MSLLGGGDLNTTDGTDGLQMFCQQNYFQRFSGFKSYLLDVTVDGELTSGQGADHEETGTDSTVRALKTKLLGDLDQTAGGALTGKGLGLVDLGKHGVGGLGHKGGGETSNETGTKVDGGVHATRGGGLVNQVGVDVLGNLLVDDELGHGVGDPGILLVSAAHKSGVYTEHTA
jgi:hypothetical protein